MTQYTISIDQLAFGGNGVGRTEDGMVVFVPFTAPGDVVTVSTVKEHKRYCEAAILEIVEPGPSRVESRCPLFGQCGGCQYQHVRYDAQLQAKQQQLLSLLQRVGRQTDIPELDQTTPAPDEYGYRNRITLEPRPGWRPDDQDLPFGYYALDNRTVIPVASCPLAEPPLERLIAIAQEHPRARKESARDRPGRLNLRMCRQTGPRFFFGRGRHGPGWLHETIDNRDVRVPERSFWQTNSAVAALRNSVAAYSVMIQRVWLQACDRDLMSSPRSPWSGDVTVTRGQSPLHVSDARGIGEPGDVHRVFRLHHQVRTSGHGDRPSG